MEDGEEEPLLHHLLPARGVPANELLANTNSEVGWVVHQSLRKMNNPNIVKLKEVIMEKDVLYFVFEYMAIAHNYRCP
ncbi:Cyclin-dependent kinase F-4 [Nymphaea thermarum]|nr:Cyclin-dependent kinase F-4 [Nymphaea thermarum]